MANLKIDKEDLAFIRRLEDFDLIMLLSEIHYNGWENDPPYARIGGKHLLPMIREVYAKGLRTQ
jgi:hypothetical protein